MIESSSDIEVYRRCIPNARIQVCRLTADVQLRFDRLRAREIGAGLEWHLNRTQELDAILDRAGLEDFTVDNGARPLGQVALELLHAAGWPPGTIST